MNDRQAVILAALLHDVGKFAQRAGQALTATDRRIEPDCCPLWKGRYSHTHVLFSGKWIREVLGEHFSPVEILALFHHRPETCTEPRLAKIVALADRLSSGERESRPEEEAGQRVSEILLTCLFTKLGDNGKDYQDFPMQAMEPDLTPWLSPGPHPANYPTLWEGFTREAARLDQGADFRLLCHQILALLEKYTFFMPAAAYRDRPDISLYHHLKASAALAACLYDLNLTEEFLDQALSALKPASGRQEVLGQPAFSLVAADMSGIQDFIYSVTSEKALKGLKGRSLYLELLARAVAEQLLGELDLPLTNLLFLGGGHFYLLAPNTSTVQDTVVKWQQLANRVLLQAHGGRLALSLHSQAVTYRQFLRGAAPGFADAWRQAATGLAREKRRKFASFWQDGTPSVSILGPLGAVPEGRACTICSEELTQEADDVCPACLSFTELARRAAGASYLEIILSTPKPLSFKVFSFREVFQALGANFYFYGSEGAFNPADTWLLNDTDIFARRGPCQGFTFMAHHVPRHPDDSVKTLEDLAENAQGIKKWGLLRADVDNLGQVFTKSLGAEDRTLSRVSTLSQLLSLFFSGHVQALVTRESAYRDSVYLVYAGGDDLCLLAPWSLLPDLARRLREDFWRYTRGRLTLSAGLYLAPREKFPVYQAADEAGELVAAAKRQGKDRLGLFNHTVSWGDLPTLASIKDLLQELLDSYGVPRSLLSLLRASWQEMELHKKGELPFYRIWRLLYGLRRLTDRLRRDQKEQAIATLNRLEQTLIINHHLRTHMDIAIRWAEYLTRRED